MAKKNWEEHREMSAGFGKGWGDEEEVVSYKGSVVNRQGDVKGCSSEEKAFAAREVFDEVRIKFGIIKEESLSPLFVLMMIPLMILLKREIIGYKLGKGAMELEGLINVVRVFVTGYGVGLDKCCLGIEAGAEGSL